MTRWVAACDLDQTLVYSRRAFRLPAGAPEPELAVAEHLDGAPASYLTVRAAGLLRELARVADLVPTTTRTLAQLARVDLGLPPADAHAPVRYAVAANGGHLLVDGRPDDGWNTAVAARLAAGGAPPELVLGLVPDVLGAPWVRTWRLADGLFAYVVAHRREDIPPGLAAELGERLDESGWGVSVQGRKVYLVPRALTKEAAVEEVRHRVARTGAGPAGEAVARPPGGAGLPPLAAAGDSLLDAGLLAAADAAVRPAHGELHDAGWTCPGLTVTPAAGLAAGEQVAQALLTICSPASRSAPVSLRVGVDNSPHAHAGQ